MNKKRLPLVLAVGALLCLLSGCAFSTANIGSAVLARGYVNGSAAGVTTSFHPSDNPLHLVVTLNNAPDGTTLKVDWVAVNVGKQHNYKIFSSTITTANGENIADFDLTNRGTWPPGTYKAVVYLNDTLDRTVSFPII
jgi:hypothetical protein